MVTIGAAALLVAAFLDGGRPASLLAQEAPRPGGTLRVATIGEPPSLDLHWSTGAVTQEITWHVYETLYTYDRRYDPVPLLAAGHTLSDGGRRYTIALRQGVRFHNGREMNAADVITSLQRWGRIATLGKLVWSGVVSIEERGPHTVVVTLREPSGSLLSALSRPTNGAAILPREVIEAAGEGQIRSFVGTGPYRFVEHLPDRHVRLARFGDYAARPEPPDGYGGRRTAYVDEILFIPVPDSAVRLAGLESGQYDFAYDLLPEWSAHMSQSQRVAGVVIKPATWPAAGLNHRQGLMTSRQIREAFRSALDVGAIMAVGMGHPDFYRVDGAIFFPEQPLWHSSVGTEPYNRRDLGRARSLLREAGYRGEPVRWLTTREYEYMYRMAVMAKQQLEEAGFVVDLQVLDSATLIHRRNRPELFDVFSTVFGFSPDPALSSALQCTWAGWWCHPEKEQLLARLASETNVPRRRALVDQIQALFYADVGRVKFGDAFWLYGRRRELRGVQPALEGPLWNTWLAVPPSPAR